MAKATDAEILAAAHVLRDARAVRDAAYDAMIRAKAECMVQDSREREANRAVEIAKREFDRLLELRDHPEDEAA